MFHSDAVRVDPDSLLSVRTKSRFEELLHRYDNVFNPLFSGYNGAVGPLKPKSIWAPYNLPKGKADSHSIQKINFAIYRKCLMN